MHRSIFVSSTFRDMHLERDAIHTRIIPALNAQAARWGDSVSACDLRWGINTAGMEDEDSSRKVLSVCLGEIDRCRPYMIVLLGYRYGWIPDGDLIDKTLEERGASALNEKDLSVTALEVEYGALSRVQDPSHTLFYFRELDGTFGDFYGAEDDLHRRKLDDLKRRIQAMPGARVRTYHLNVENPDKGIEAFSDMVAGDLYALMLGEWKENASLDAYAIDQKRQWEFLEEKNAQFLSRENLLNECVGALADGDILLHGETGSGKSTLISRVGKAMSENGADVVPIFCGYTSLTTSGFDVLKYIVYELERRMGLDHLSERETASAPDRAAWLSRLNELYGQYALSGNQELVFLIDGIDQLAKDEIAQGCLFLPEEKNGKIRFALSTVTSEKMPLDRQINVGDLGLDERLQVVRGILSARRKELSDAAVDRMIRMRNARLPLYLNLVIQRLVMMDHEDFLKIASLGEGIDAIDRYQQSLIGECPDTLEELSVRVMERASDQIGGQPVRLMSYFLAVSRRGLRFSDLEGLVGSMRTQDGRRMALSMADGAGFIQYFGSFFFTRSDGRIDFTHKCFRQGLLDNIGDVTPMHGFISMWLRRLPQSDEVRNQEISWHLIQADAADHLGDLMAEELSNKALCSAAARDLAVRSLEDGGEWLKKSLRENLGYPCFTTYSGFICYNVFYELPDTQSGIRLQHDIVRTILDMEEGMLASRQDHGLKWDISINYERLSSLESRYGTQEHAKNASEYAERCLEIRRGLLKNLDSIDTYEKRVAFIEEALARDGRALSKKPTPEQCEGFIEGMRREMVRGVCVADEMMAKSLKWDYPHTAQRALQYLEESLEKRESLRRDGDGENFAVGAVSEEYELATIHLEIASAYRSLEDEASLNEAKGHILSAIAISEEAVRDKPNPDHAIILAQSYRIMAGFLLDRGPDRADQGIVYAGKGLSLMEDAYRRSRDAKDQMELSLQYNLMAELYKAKGDEESLSLSHEYYQKMNDLARGMLNKSDSLAGKRVAVTAGINEAVSGGGLSLEEMKTYFRQAYSQAKELYAVFPNEENLYGLERVFTALIHVIENADFGGEPIGRRAVIEVKAARLDVTTRAAGAPLDTIKNAVVACMGLSEELTEMRLPDDAMWPGDWLELFECVGVSRDLLTVMPAQRALELAERSCELARHVCAEEDSLLNQDTLAVSLSKLAQAAMQVDLSRFAQVNDELTSLAESLLRQTGGEKYRLMLFQAQLGRHILDGTAGSFVNSLIDQAHGVPPEEPPREEERQYWSEKDMRDAARSIGEKEAAQAAGSTSRLKAVEARIADIERELASATGVFAVFKKNRLKKELEELKAELKRLRT